MATSLGYLARVYARLEGLCREAPLGPLWSIASGLVEGLANGSVVNSASVRHPCCASSTANSSAWSSRAPTA